MLEGMGDPVVKVDEEEFKVKKKAISPFDFVNAIHHTKADMIVDDWSEKQAGYINDLLEYVRDANFELRKSSKYWYDKYKEAA